MRRRWLVGMVVPGAEPAGGVGHGPRAARAGGGLGRRALIGGLAAVAGGRPRRGRAAGGAPLVGYLSDSWPSDLVARAQVEALRQGLAEQGLAVDRDLRLAAHFVPLAGDLRSSVVGELARAGARVIVTNGTLTTREVLAAAPTLPVVMASTPDPLAEGLVRGLARPGGSVTGLAFQGDDLWEKQASLLGEVVPGPERIAVLAETSMPGGAERLARAGDRLRRAGFAPLPLAVASSHEYRAAMDDAKANGAQGLLALDDPNLVGLYRNVLALHTEVVGLPAIGAHRFYAEDGLLMSYGADPAALARRAAWYVRQILDGSPPGSLPIEQPTRFDLVINLRTAAALGLTVPPAILLRAEEVIE